MEFEMSSAGRLYVAVHRLHDRGYLDASKADPRTGDSVHVLRVTAEDEASAASVNSIVIAVDPESRPMA